MSDEQPTFPATESSPAQSGTTEPVPAQEQAPASVAPAANVPAQAPAPLATPPAPVPPPVQAPIQSTITATAPNPAPAPDAPKVDATSTDNHKGALQLHLSNAIKEAQERRGAYRETALIIKEDRFIAHLEGMLATLRQLSLRVF